MPAPRPEDAVDFKHDHFPSYYPWPYQPRKPPKPVAVRGRARAGLVVRMALARWLVGFANRLLGS